MALGRIAFNGTMDPTSPLPFELHCRDRAIDLHDYRLGLYLLPPRILTRRHPWPRGSSLLYTHTEHLQSAISYHHLRADEYWPSYEREVLIELAPITSVAIASRSQ
jgi:hypothetical protein